MFSIKTAFMSGQSITQTVLFEEKGKMGIVLELKEKDPDFLKKHNDPQRLKRALEVVWSTGKSILFYQSVLPKAPDFKFHKILIDIDREVLRQRIHARILEMIDMGVVEEVYNYMNTCNIQTCAIGYAEIKDYILGNLSLDKTIKYLPDEGLVSWGPNAKQGFKMIPGRPCFRYDMIMFSDSNFIVKLDRKSVV